MAAAISGSILASAALPPGLPRGAARRAPSRLTSVSNSCDWRTAWQVGAEQPVGAAASRRPSELKSTSGRSAGARGSAAPARSRPSPACACRAMHEVERLARVEPAQRLGGDGAVARPCPTWRSAAPARGGSWRCRRPSARACPRSSGCDAEQPAMAPSAAARRSADDREPEGRALAPGPRSPPTSGRPSARPAAWLIARPRPVPPYLRVVDESACENDWNSRPAARRDADAGVAHREVSSHAPSRAARCGRDRQHDLARVGELDRVAEQVEQDLPQPRHVAADRAGTSPSKRTRGRALLGAPAPRGRAPIRRTRAGRTAAPRCPAGRPRSSRSRGCR